MAQALLAHLSMIDGSDEVQHSLLTHWTGVQVEVKSLLGMLARLQRGNTLLASSFVCALLTRRGNYGGTSLKKLGVATWACDALEAGGPYSRGAHDGLACIEYLEGTHAGHRAIQWRPAGKTLRVMLYGSELKRQWR